MGIRRSQLEGLLKEFSDDPEIYYGLAMDSINDGFLLQGIDELRSIVLRHPQFIPSYLQLGQALVREGQEDQAADVYRAGIVVAKKVGAIQAADEMSRFLEQLS
jgi:Tfp pilus assembly protein PilF